MVKTRGGAGAAWVQAFQRLSWMTEAKPAAREGAGVVGPTGVYIRSKYRTGWNTHRSSQQKRWRLSVAVWMGGEVMRSARWKLAM